MKKIDMNDIVVVGCVATMCCALTACTSLQSQMKSYDGDIRSAMGDGHWDKAKRIIDTAQFECSPVEQEEVDAWRSREHIQMKNTFAKSLQPTIARAKGLYDAGSFAEGDQVRQALKDRGITDCLTPCVELAWVQMLSDRNLARMSASFKEYLCQINEIDANGGKKSIKQLNAIAVGLKKVDKWKDKVDLFMKMLADPETRRWTPVDRSEYAVSIKKMSAIRDDALRQYRTKRWNTRVIDRKADYKKVGELTAAKNYQEAMQLLSSHDLLVKPEGLKGVVDFDDQAERAQVASGVLGEEMVRTVFQTGLSGVQYSRRDPRRGMLSALIVGRTLVDDKRNRRKLREAGRVAQMQARSEFVKFMGTSVSTESEMDSIEEDDKTREKSHVNLKEKAEAEVSNLAVLATGVDGNEVVFILGWRDPDLGMITPVPMHRVAGEENFTVSPSVGAYL